MEKGDKYERRLNGAEGEKDGERCEYVREGWNGWRE